MTPFGVAWVFFAKTQITRTASGSIRHMTRHVAFSSVTRSSMHRRPTLGIGRASGMPSEDPSCNRPTRKPASLRALMLIGGVRISSVMKKTGFLCMAFTGPYDSENAIELQAENQNRLKVSPRLWPLPVSRFS